MFNNARLIAIAFASELSWRFHRMILKHYMHIPPGTRW